MFIDELEIAVRAGNGGNGALSFHREKYVAKGGPDGGHGGHGGNVVLRATANRNTLHHFKGLKLFSAKNGQGGEGCNRAGKAGEDLILDVPVGTLVLENGKLMTDLDQNGEMWIAARGGLGGKGNSNFATSTRQLPRFAELGEPGEEKKLKLELKLLADVGIIGLPSVGKSTLISVISAAKPKIAAYHFTTLAPNLGVVDQHGETFVVSDMPGLIKGASRGKGLGHQFLRHSERVKFFWHLISGESTTPITDYKTIREELRKYNPELSQKPEVVVISKADICDEKTLIKSAQKLEKICKKRPLIISAPTHEGVKDLLNLTIEELQTLGTKNQEPRTPNQTIYRPHLDEKSKTFSVKRQNKKLYLVDGPRLSQIVVMSDLTNPEALARVQDVLKKFGVSRELRRLGAEPGAKLTIAGKGLEWWG
ncbi:MAG: GTPase ObgE [Patescibacteria group bacterium]